MEKEIRQMEFDYYSMGSVTDQQKNDQPRTFREPSLDSVIITISETVDRFKKT